MRAIADLHGPAMLIDAGLHILHCHGAVTPFLSFPSGSPEMNLAQLIVPELANEALTTVFRARRRNTVALSRKRRIGALGGSVWRLAIHPVGEQTDAEFFLVVFESGSSTPRDSDKSAGRTIDAVEQATLDADHDELLSAREHLQTLTEEMAASNEEMQALNEEVQAANEELQAINEELEASNEELQATNEELISVNEESQIKSLELAIINSDFESVYNTIDFPVLVFDIELSLKRANGVATRSYNLPMSASGQHVGRLLLPDFLKNIDQRLAEALSEGRKQNYTAESGDRTYKVYVTPVLNSMAIPQGVVLVVIDNSDMVKAQRQIRESQEQLLGIMNHSVSVVSLKDAAGRYEFVNLRFQDLFGVVASELVGRTDQQVFGPEIARVLRAQDHAAMDQMMPIESLDELDLAHGKVWLETVRFPIFDSAGVVRAVCSQASDVTRRRHADEQLRLAAKVFDRAGEAILITDAEGSIITANEAFTKITGYSLDEVIGKSPSLLQSGQHSADFYEGMWCSLLERGSWQGEIFNRRKNGEIFPELLTINSVKDEEDETVNYVSIFSDITAIKSSQRRIEFLATHDELTGLPNRSLLLDRLKHGLSQVRRQKTQLAVMFIDLDNFKNINDSLGHDVGDELLRQAADRLQRCVRTSDTLARLGGDEFVAILVDVGLDEINTVAGRVIDFMATSFGIRERNLFVSASIGISIFPSDGDDAVTLLKNADVAMYRSKSRGRNQYQFFAEEMKVVALQRMTLETGLRLAIESNRFHVCYQPQVDLKNGAIVGAEALLRWRDPTLGEIGPAQFIPVAEGCGLMAAIGDIVISQVLRKIAEWRAAGLTVPPVAINVSAYQLRDDGFAEKLVALLDSLALPPASICLEITEGTLIDRLDLVQGMLVSLQQRGVAISIDDFGTGYSSLSYLKKLPLRELKIDRSFVDGIADDHDDRAIAIAVIDMAHALGLRVVAEGVETAEQLEVLNAEGCDIVQGFLFHRPMTDSDFATVLRSAAAVESRGTGR